MQPILSRAFESTTGASSALALQSLRRMRPQRIVKHAPLTRELPDAAGNHNDPHPIALKPRATAHAPPLHHAQMVTTTAALTSSSPSADWEGRRGFTLAAELTRT